MCGICGMFDLRQRGRVDEAVIRRMTAQLYHRGPDGENVVIANHGNLGFGFSRLSIIDLEGGMQPLFNEDGSIMLICNGEIFNYIELREDLIQRGHTFKTRTDVEVLVHLYEESGPEFLNQLNAQFSFAIFDFKKQQLFCARDHFGVLPFFYTLVDGLFIFGSEIKAILEYPGVKREADLVGLDQVFTFPGLVSPRTMFKHIKSLENGHYLLVKPDGDRDEIRDVEYWDVIYPEIHAADYRHDDAYYVKRLEELITESVRLRLRSDVPVGIYISGGLDSSVITALTHRLTPENRRHSFAIDFLEKEISESKFQRLMAKSVNSDHHEILFRFGDISSRLPQAIRHCECAIKETYNTASFALSESVRSHNIKVVLTGEGSDEFFAGYVGYRFDKMRQMQKKTVTPETPFEDAIRRRLWGDENFFYEKFKYAFSAVKRDLYSEQVNADFDAIHCINHFVVNNERLKNRDNIHKRSYLDYKLRLADHLISDHGDRQAMANSVEARYPFLDKNLVEFAATVPPDLKLKDFDEKYIVKRMASGLVPPEIIKREKFGFVAPGSPYLLNRNIEYINDLLSYERIKKQGYFNPDSVERLKKQYSQEGFRLNLPFDSDLLITVITFGIFLDQFGIGDFVA
ncbi:MAG: asparagine synthase (glutamine-hydrolyzing) [Candidatus Omnitrophota bacterium]